MSSSPERVSPVTMSFFPPSKTPSPLRSRRRSAWGGYPVVVFTHQERDSMSPNVVPGASLMTIRPSLTSSPSPRVAFHVACPGAASWMAQRPPWLEIVDQADVPEPSEDRDRDPTRADAPAGTPICANDRGIASANTRARNRFVAILFCKTLHHDGVPPGRI